MSIFGMLLIALAAAALGILGYAAVGWWAGRITGHPKDECRPC